MGDFNSNILLVLFVAIILIAVIYYLNQKNQCPVPPQLNQTTHKDTFEANLSDQQNNVVTQPRKSILRTSQSSCAVNPRPVRENRSSDTVEDLINCVFSESNSENNGGVIGAETGTSYATFTPSETGCNSTLSLDSENDFEYKKQKYRKQTRQDIEDQFDIDKMLPRDIEEDWFDVVPLRKTKKICGTALVHPKKQMGMISSINKNASNDIRGDIPIPKICVSPWGMSTIDADMESKGLDL